MINYDPVSAAAVVANPATSGLELAEIAALFPALRTSVAAHPNAYPQLLDWLVAQGDPAVAAVVAQRRRAVAPYPPASPRRAPARGHGGLFVFLSVAVVAVAAVIITAMVLTSSPPPTPHPVGSTTPTPHPVGSTAPTATKSASSVPSVRETEPSGPSPAGPLLSPEKIQRVLDSEVLADWIGDSSSMPVQPPPGPGMACGDVKPDGSNVADVWSHQWGDFATADAQRVPEADAADFVLLACDAYMTGLMERKADGWQYRIERTGFTAYLPETEYGVGLGQFCYGNLCLSVMIPPDATSLADGMATQFPGMESRNLLNDLVTVMNQEAGA